MSDHIIIVDEANFEQEVTNSDLPVVIDFWAPWCGPCMALLPTLEALAPTYEGSIKFVKINADENQSLQTKFGVRGLPTLFFAKGGEPIAQLRERTRTRLSVELDGLLD